MSKAFWGRAVTTMGSVTLAAVVGAGTKWW